MRAPSANHWTAREFPISKVLKLPRLTKACQLHLNSEQYTVTWQQHEAVDEKLISRSKKELENFIQAKRDDYNPGRASHKALGTVLLIRSQDTVRVI